MARRNWVLICEKDTRGRWLMCLVQALQPYGANTGVKGVFQLLIFWKTRLLVCFLVLGPVFGGEGIYKGQEVEQIRGLL